MNPACASSCWQATAVARNGVVGRVDRRRTMSPTVQRSLTRYFDRLLVELDRRSNQSLRIGEINNRGFGGFRPTLSSCENRAVY